MTLDWRPEGARFMAQQWENGLTTNRNQGDLKNSAMITTVKFTNTTIA